LFTLLYLGIVIISVINRYFPVQQAVTPANNGISSTYFSAAGNFRFIQVLEVWIRGTPDPFDSKRFPLKTGFPKCPGSFQDRFHCIQFRCSSIVRISPASPLLNTTTFHYPSL